MKVLLDENINPRLRSVLMVHDVFTASYMGFAGLQNGNLLRAAEAHYFQVLVTGDQTLQYEQNLKAHRIAVVVLTALRWRFLKDFVPQILEAIANAQPGSVVRVDCGVFTRRSKGRSPVTDATDSA